MGAKPLPCLLVTTSSAVPVQLLGQRSKLAKKAEGLSLNLRAMVERYGVEHCVFVTLTFRENLRCFRKAQRRYKSIETNLLKRHFVAWVTAVHRQRRGAIHYHLIAVTREDVRAGFDFETWQALRAHTELFGRDNARADKLAKTVYRSACPALASLWSMFRHEGPKYGFGRIETYPVRSNADAVGRYVGSYVRVGAENRQLRDKGMRTIRYSLPPGQRVASARFSWVDGPGKAWRQGCALFSMLTGVDDFAKEWGSRWARHLRFDIGTLGRWAERIGEKFYPLAEKFAATPKGERIKATLELVRYLQEREATEAASV